MTETIDAFGAPTTAPLSALPGINDFVAGFVAYQPRSVNVLACAEQHPDVALANLYAGCLWMFLERPEAPDKARPFLARVRACSGLNERERGLQTMLEAWLVYDTARVVRVAEDLLGRWPQDLSTLKLAQYHLFNRADSPGMLRVANACARANERRAPWHSMQAFGHEQCHDIDAAQAAAERALALDVREPWAHHALAHVHLSRGTTDQGLQLLGSHSAAWQGLNSFMFTHNWWHMALFEIAEGKADNALRVYDERCWGVQPDYSQDQIGAVSLLARLECAGIDVGDRWAALQPWLASRAADVEQPFLSVQYLYGLARANAPQADQLSACMRNQVDDPVVPGDGALWRAVGVPLAAACVAHARADYATAADGFAALRAQVWKIGGSHAQRDLFEQLMLDALWRSGQWARLRPLLKKRLQYEPHNPVLRQRLDAIESSEHQRGARTG